MSTSIRELNNETKLISLIQFLDKENFDKAIITETSLNKPIGSNITKLSNNFKIIHSPFTEHQAVSIIINIHKFSNHKMKYTSLHQNFKISKKFKLKHE